MDWFSEEWLLCIRITILPFFHSGYITELGHERKKARLIDQYKVEETADESGHQCASKLSRSLALKASTVDATLKRLFAPASKRENLEGDFNPSAVGSSKEMKRPSMSLSHRGKQFEVVCLPKMLTVLPKGPKRQTFMHFSWYVAQQCAPSLYLSTCNIHQPAG